LTLAARRDPWYHAVRIQTRAGEIRAAMVDLIKDTDSLTNFKRNTTAYVEQLRKTGQPLVLTINGKAQLVVQDAGSYQRLLELVDRLEAIEDIRQGLDEMKAGKGRPADEVFEEIRQKYKIPRGA
jgi:PHD/YefM family antitoxin component YafN of YafNO toxin-antitoxin module